ncbi:unnamed protein product [Brassica rapa]|uniref:Uncharacterized protein n=1 Tax=Brassica campestris TaxID=3711 RepID=A0A8D9GYD0_BRACM|nr:unnamed protein product [Brassica rapa]
MMKLVVFISFLLLLPFSSSGLKDGHGVTHTDQYSFGKIEEDDIEKLMDYPKPGPNVPSGPRFRRPLHPMKKPYCPLHSSYP